MKVRGLLNPSDAPVLKHGMHLFTSLELFEAAAREAGVDMMPIGEFITRVYRSTEGRSSEISASETQLQAMGLSPMVLSGDTSSAVAAMAVQAGIPAQAARGAVSPAEKAQVNPLIASRACSKKSPPLLASMHNRGQSGGLRYLDQPHGAVWGQPLCSRSHGCAGWCPPAGCS